MIHQLTRRKWLQFTALGCAVSLTRSYRQAIAADSREHVVTIQAFEFTPASLQVKSGDTITWLNKDIVPHTATATDHSWDTGALNTNEQITIKVTSEFQGTYYCLYHPNMKGAVTILP